MAAWPDNIESKKGHVSVEKPKVSFLILFYKISFDLIPRDITQFVFLFCMT